MIKFAALVALVASPCFAGAPVELVYKFEADKPIGYEMVQVMTQNQVIQGMTMETKSVSSTNSVTELLKANDDGSILIQNTTKSVKISITAPGTELSYDSTNPSDQSKLSDPTIASIAGTVGLQIQLLIASDGTILDVPNVDDIQKQVGAMNDPAIQSVIGQMMEKKTIMAANEINYKLLPETSIEIGDQWHRNFEIPIGFGVMTTSFDLTLDAVNDGIASISISGTMSMPPIEQQGVTVSMSGSKVLGSMKFNIKDGAPDLFDMTTTTEMIGTMAEMPDPILTMTMTQRVTNTRLVD